MVLELMFNKLPLCHTTISRDILKQSHELQTIDFYILIYDYIFISDNGRRVKYCSL